MFDKQFTILHACKIKRFRIIWGLTNSLVTLISGRVGNYLIVSVFKFSTFLCATETYCVLMKGG